MREKRGIDQRIAIDQGEFSLVYGGIRHRVHSFSHSAAHRNQFRLGEEVAIFLAMKDGKLIPEKGDQMLDFAAYQFPEFNNFNRWAAHNTDPKDSNSYKKALDSLWQALDACAGATVDRSNPDLKQYLYLQTPTGRKKACWSEGAIAPHSFEGFMLNLGNGLVKAGQVEAARVMYANAKYADNYSTWPYRKYLEEVANSDLYARAALYADNDYANDPPTGVPNRGCSYCHATVPEPDTPTSGGQK